MKGLDSELSRLHRESLYSLGKLSSCGASVLVSDEGQAGVAQDGPAEPTGALLYVGSVQARRTSPELSEEEEGKFVVVVSRGVS